MTVGRVAATLIGVALVLIGLFLLRGTPREEARTGNAGEARTPAAASALASPTSGPDAVSKSRAETIDGATQTPESRRARAELALLEARASHERSVAVVEDAEKALNDLEREIDAVERFVEDLEERGEDPAKHAFDGMEKLDPIIERFEERMRLLEEAEAEEAAARAQLEAAKLSLEAIRGSTS